jgi:hypothetical protein
MGVVDKARVDDCRRHGNIRIILVRVRLFGGRPSAWAAAASHRECDVCACSELATGYATANCKLPSRDGHLHDRSSSKAAAASPSPLQMGRRLHHVCVLSGSVVRVWGVLEAVLARNERLLPRMEQGMRVVGRVGVSVAVGARRFRDRGGAWFRYGVPLLGV